MKQTKKNPYQSFDNYVLRSPLLPLKTFMDLTGGPLISEEAIKGICENRMVKEGLFLASPVFYQQLEKWLSGQVTDKDEAIKIKSTLLKYLSRMSSRCTPFGLFAGTALGSFSAHTEIKLDRAEKFNRHTRLDMNYLVALSQDLEKNGQIREQLIFYPNSSIYYIGAQCRYIEYHYKRGKRIHQVVSLEESLYVEKVLKAAKQGVRLSQLSSLLVDAEITLDEATAFINKLVDSQLLVSELEPSVSGPEFLDQIFSILEKLTGTTAIVQNLKKVNKHLAQVDCKMGNAPAAYLKITEALKTLSTGFDIKYMFQTDLVLSCKKNTLDKKILSKVYSAMSFLNKISLKPEETKLQKFGKSLNARFQDKALPIAHAVDTELGIAYGQNTGSGDISLLVDDIVLPSGTRSMIQKFKWTKVHAILNQKLIEALKSKSHTVYLTDSDFEGFEAQWTDLPDSLSAMAEVVVMNGEERISVSGFGGSSAANLIGRFCHSDERIYQFTEQVVRFEEQAKGDKLLAEVVHLPESRVGNILMRPTLRTHEIPYLARSLAKEDGQLSVDDLSVRANHLGEVTLTSSRKNKEVLPHLTNAHKYSGKGLPVYQLLGDLQLQSTRTLGFNWGPLAGEHRFLPRVEYKGVIISKARWSLPGNTLQDLLNCQHDENLLTKAIKEWRSAYRIPQYFMLSDGDNELLINSRNISMMRLFLKLTGKREGFRITEFLHAENGVVRSGVDFQTNQVLLTFFNSDKLKNASHEAR